MSAPICLTDPPEVVALKREFFKLDGRKEVLKPLRQSSDAVRRDLERISLRQKEIAQTLFHLRPSASICG